MNGKFALLLDCLTYPSFWRMKVRWFTGLWIAVLALGFQGCGPAPCDQSDPRNVVQRLFDAARADDPRMLAGLCDPDHNNDGDTECICALDPGYSGRDPDVKTHCHLSWEEFKIQFSKGRLAHDPGHEPNEAQVEFYYGRYGKKRASMAVNYKNGMWYLHSI